MDNEETRYQDDTLAQVGDFIEMTDEPRSNMKERKVVYVYGNAIAYTCKDENGKGFLFVDKARHFIKAKEPDTIEKTRADALKDMTRYWGCPNYNCDECSAKIDGKIPREKYGVDNCHVAMKADLVERAFAVGIRSESNE